MSHRLLVKDPRGQREILLVGTMSVGRDPRCDISDADPLLSRRHAEFVVSDDGVLVRDLNSRNGILVNGRKVRHADLQPGDVVQISGLAITLISTRPKAPPPAVGEPAEDKTLLVTPLPARHTPGTLAVSGDRVPSASDAGPKADEGHEPATQPGTRRADQIAVVPANEPVRAAAVQASRPLSGADGTLRVPRKAGPDPVSRSAGADSEPPASTVIVPRAPGAAPGTVPAATLAEEPPSETAGDEARTVFVPRRPARPVEAGPAVEPGPGASAPSAAAVEPPVHGPIEKVKGVEAPPAAAGKRAALAAPATEPSGAPVVSVPAVEPQPPGQGGLDTSGGPPSTPPVRGDASPPADEDKTRFVPHPAPVVDLPLRPPPPAAPMPAAGGAGRTATRAAAAVGTPVRAPSKAAGPWVVAVVGASVTAAAVSALIGAAAVTRVGATGSAIVAAVAVAVLLGFGAGLVVQRRFARAMRAMTDDVDLAVIGRLEEVGDPFGDPRARQLADAVNELVTRVREGRS